MSLLVLTLIVSMVLIAGYFTYGRFIANMRSMTRTSPPQHG
jgi:carbon starvation protein CstA